MAEPGVELVTLASEASPPSRVGHSDPPQRLERRSAHIRVQSVQQAVLQHLRQDVHVRPLPRGLRGVEAVAEAVYAPIPRRARGSAAKKSRVRFSNIMEVRQLPWSAGAEADPQPAAPPDPRQPGVAPKAPDKLSPSQVAKISFFFCFVWFLANLSYQEALSDSQVALVNILSSTSGLFTLLLAAIFPSNAGDRFTLSKLLAVLLSIGGVVLVDLAGPDSSPKKDALGSAWSLAGAALYAVYIVMIKRKVEREDRLDIAMFFGFVGLFNLLLLWPGFFVFHYAGWEAFELPSRLVWFYIFLNGLVGTVLSEFLWLWGCFLTSSLIGTLAISLTIPLSVIADMCVRKVQFSWLFLAGSVPVFLSFVTVTLLCHYNNWDPVTVGIRRVFAFICRKHRIQRFSEDGEHCQSLIPLHDTQPEDETGCSS
ncbi:solute carrier family 35 member F5 isoform X5 [Ornithorhynchus anatinus]|uniref:solute carrier family 35 member F5 isoform X5 n=1 Tax=Ornithorhynchus anatinus TaxID=9258 RepID=UPI0010A84D71|nr:solute carrier family 35 member F5 isoform X5 [Ornithorhynchus anatinus]